MKMKKLISALLCTAIIATAVFSVYGVSPAGGTAGTESRESIADAAGRIDGYEDEHDHDHIEPAAEAVNDTEISDGAYGGSLAESSSDAEQPSVPETSSDAALPPEAEIPDAIPDTMMPGISLMAVPTIGNVRIEVEGYEGYFSGNNYCKMPKLIVTDENGTLKTVTVWMGKSSERKKIGDYTASEDQKSRFELELVTEVSGQGHVTVEAENEAGEKAETTFYVGHTDLQAGKTVELEATCTMPPRTISYLVCKVCNTNYGTRTVSNKDGSPLGHAFTEEVELTIGEQPVTALKCERCGYMKIDSGLSDCGEDEAHAWQQEEGAAGCTTDGCSFRYCTKCGKVDEKSFKRVAALGHNFFGSPWETTREPNCGPGLQTRTCARCGQAKETREIPAGHVWGDTLEIVKEATCTETGDLGYRCVNCKTVNPDNILKGRVPAKGHSYGENGDCTKPSQCTVCHAEIPAKSGHAWAFETDAEGHTRYCTNNGCTVREAKAPHESAKEVADCTKNYLCTVCGYAAPAHQTQHSLVQMQDNLYHWNKCTNDGCSYETAKIPHKWTGDDQNCLTEKKCTDCGYVAEPAKSAHDFSGKWMYNITNHYRVCQTPGCTQREPSKEHTIDYSVRDCTKGVGCSVCGYMVYERSRMHNFNGAPWRSDGQGGHYQVCVSSICDVRSESKPHTVGTKATCKERAVCAECREPIGEIDPDNHAGPIVLTNAVNPTFNSEGYSGDYVCRSCEVITEAGRILPKTDCSHPSDKVITEYDDEKSWSRCTNCGWIGNQIPHRLGAWLSNGSEHWQKCESCQYETNHVSHTTSASSYDNDCTTEVDCEVCGYRLVEAYRSHSFGGSYIFTAGEHWQICQNPDCAVTSAKTAHTFKEGGDCTAPVSCTDCGYTLRSAMPSHTWSGVWVSDDPNVHYQICLNEDCTKRLETAHAAAADDGLCTTAVLCADCGRVLTAAMPEHKFGGAYQSNAVGHWRTCQNNGCKAAEAEAPHSGGIATCKSRALCEVCGGQYGETDPDNHASEKENRGYKAPTETEQGYTGDLYCLGCGQLVETGVWLERLEEGHVHEYTLTGGDDDSHWKECACGTRDVSEQHTFGAYEFDNTEHWATCTQCGRTVRSEHELSLRQDENGHWDGCARCGVRYAEAAHSFVDGVCTVCQRPEQSAEPTKPSGSGSSSSSDEGGSSRSSQSADPERSGQWVADAKGWWFRFSDGSWPKSEWRELKWQFGKAWYYFNADGYMATGWITDGDRRYYLHPIADGDQGYMYTGWHLIDGKWYYFSTVHGGPLGSLLVDTVTPDGYRVGADGAWIQ